MNTFSIVDSLKYGWETLKKNPLFIIGVFVALFVISMIVSAVTDPQGNGGSLLGALASLLIGVCVEMMVVNLALKGHSAPQSLKLADLWSTFPFLYYVAQKVLSGIIIIVGLILLIAPGVIAALALMFSSYLVMDKNLGPIEAMKESARITKGHRMQLFLFALTLGLLNIAGALALGIGLLVTVPVSIFAVAHVYRFLEQKAGAPTHHGA